jgi:transposase
MKQIDGRALTASALEERRRIIIRMKEGGYSEKEIIAATGCSRQTISPLWDKYKKSENKDDLFQVQPRGNKFGNGRNLTIRQENKIKRLIMDKYPEQLKFDYALWTREAVRQLVRKEFDIDMPIRTMGEYLKRWGYTPQKPIKYAYERDGEKVREWLEKTYPGIKRRAKKEKAEIYWGDETTVKAGDVRGRGYAPKGETPIVNRTQKKEDVSMVSAITNQGKVFWKLHEGSINAEKFVDFVKRLTRNKKGKVYLILDNARTRHSRKLTEWAGKNRAKIELFYLPPYSPDLNPDEHVNSDVKYGVGAKVPKRTREGLRAATEEMMKILKKTPNRIVKYFKDPAIQYAS